MQGKSAIGPTDSAQTVTAKPKTSRPATHQGKSIWWLNRAVFYLSIPLFIGLWQIISTSGAVNRLLTPAPLDVVRSLVLATRDGLLPSDIFWSISRVLIGYVAGASLGIGVGLVTARLEFLNSLLSPILQLLRPIPPIAIVPLVIIWFGLSEWGKYFLVGWGVFFVVWVATFMGVQKVNPLLIRAAQSLGVPERKLLSEVIFPGALPYIVVGLRTSVTIAFYTLVAAEVAGTFAGVAYRVDMAHQNMQTGLMVGSLFVLGIISAAADYGFNTVARRLVFWH